MKKIYNLHSFFKCKTNKANKVYLFFLILAAIFPGSFYSQQSYTFTPCGATGSVGPTQTQVNGAYFSTNLSGQVNSIISGIQTWTVPYSGNFRIEARGAQGGTSTSTGGFGATMTGDFALTGGEVIRILVGQQGLPGSGTQPGGGGGGSFVVRTPYTTTTSILLIAGGGTGGGAYTDNPGLITTAGGMGGVSGGANGTGGLGGIRGAGGGGFLTDGDPCSASTTYASPGQAFVNGGRGGPATNNVTCAFIADGGFGGGSSGGGFCFLNGGAGGGFSGGGGSSNSSSGGGGSLNQGTNQLNTGGNNSGNGRVLITELCSIQVFASGTNSTNPSICSGNSLSLTTTAVSNYTWSTGNTTSTMIVVSPTSTQTYSIIGTSSLSCQSSGAIVVTVSSGLPVLSISNPSNNICLGRAALLTASGAISYTWTGGPGISNGVPFVPPGGTNNYTVTGQNGCGSANAVTSITVSPLPVSIVASSTIVCAGSTTTLTANSTVSGYTWQPTGPITGSTAIFGPVANTVYTVTASDGTCSGVASIAIQAKPIPTLSIVSSATAVCQGAPVTMTASGALTYSWSPVNLTGVTISDNPTGPTLYVVTGTNAVGCSASTSTFVLTNASPTPAIAANKTFVCAGDQVILTASGASSYMWTGGPPTAGYNVNPQVTTDYIVTGTSNGCSGSTTITINVLTASVAIASSTNSICDGGSAILTASGANSYTWTGFSSLNPLTVTPTITTTYTLNANTTTATVPGLKCPSSGNITITVFNNPTVSIQSSVTKTMVCKQDAAIILTGQGATTYTWTNNNATTSTISVHPQTTTTYNITGMDTNGCLSTGLRQVTVSNCTGIGTLKNVDSGISVYPNPNTGEFTVSSDSDMNLKIVNELGQEVKTLKLSEQNDHKVSVNNLAIGIYFIVGQNENGKVIPIGIGKKIVVTK